MKYSDSIKLEMQWLSKQKDVVFIGQGIVKGDRIYGTLNDVPTNKCIEMPIAENLIMGVANGLAIKGFRPIVIFQRMDFMLIAADQIINHLSTMDKMSNEQYKPKVIIRTCIGSQCEKFDVGIQHKHDFKHIFDRYITTLWYDKDVYKTCYEATKDMNESFQMPVLIVEEKDKYDTEV